MTVTQITLRLTPEEVIRLKQILIDKDQEEALLFLKKCLKPQLNHGERSHMVREFENT